MKGTERQKATDSRAYSSNMQPLSRLRVLSLACKITSLMYLSVYFFCLLVVSVYAFLPAFLTTSLQVCPCLCVVCLYSLTPLVFLLFCWTCCCCDSLYLDFSVFPIRSNLFLPKSLRSLRLNKNRTPTEQKCIYKM